jgi:hypothetical protein
MYVSATGVLIYLVLYHLDPWLLEAASGTPPQPLTRSVS